MSKERNWGGKREGAGRPKMEETLRIRDLMDKHIDPDFVAQRLFDRIDNGDQRAIELYLKYRVGLPKQEIDLTSTSEVDLNITLANLIKFKED